MLDLLGYSWKVYTKNLGIIIFFSIPFIIALAIPLFSPDITFSALGAQFLRSGSIPEKFESTVAVIVATLLSIFLLSLALVAINLIVKGVRTRTKIKSEDIAHLGGYTFVVFSLFLTLAILELIILTLSMQRNISELPTLIFGFIASLGLFYAAPAVVLDERKPVHAVVESYRQVLRKPVHFIVWLILAFVSLSLVMVISYSLLEVFNLPRIVMQAVVILVNSLLILPYLIILQAQIYLTKYTIIK